MAQDKVLSIDDVRAGLEHLGIDTTLGKLQEMLRSFGDVHPMGCFGWTNCCFCPPPGTVLAEGARLQSMSEVAPEIAASIASRKLTEILELLSEVGYSDKPGHVYVTSGSVQVAELP